MIIPRYQLVCRLAGNDGNCQFRSVSLCKYGTESLHLKLRALVAIEMKNRGEFYNKFKCHGERDISKPGTWGGEATLVALARVTRSKVVVYQGWKVIFTYNGGNSALFIQGKLNHQFGKHYIFDVNRPFINVRHFVNDTLINDHNSSFDIRIRNKLTAQRVN